MCIYVYRCPVYYQHGNYRIISDFFLFQFVDRLYLFVQPVKYQPDLTFLRHVQLYKVHIFTFVQICCLGILWAVKSIKVISIGFPLMVSVLHTFIYTQLCFQNERSKEEVECHNYFSPPEVRVSQTSLRDHFRARGWRFLMFAINE